MPPIFSSLERRVAPLSSPSDLSQQFSVSFQLDPLTDRPIERPSRHAVFAAASGPRARLYRIAHRVLSYSTQRVRQSVAFVDNLPEYPDSRRPS